MEFKRFLLPTDFSVFAKEAVQYACLFTEKFDGELHLLHVIHDRASEVPDFGMGLAFPGYLENIPEHREKLEEEAIASLTKVLYPGWQEGRRVVIATKFGHPFLEIVRYAREHDISLIVMGTHGRSGLAHALIGSVAENVVRKAPCPVMTVRSKSHRFKMP